MRLSSLLQPASRASGVTLLEMAMGMMIVAVLSVGISSLMGAGVQSQMAERTNQNMQTIANNIVDDIRFDIRQADSVNVSGGGNLLTLNTPNGTVTYQLSGPNFIRRSPSGNKTYNNATLYNNQLSVACPQGPCFVESSMNSQNQPRQVLLPSLKVLQNTATNSVIDVNFGAPNYTIRNFAFDVMSATEFQ